MRMYNFFRKMLICTVVASIYPSFAFSAETCPSGYISVVPDATLSDDAIIVTDADTCPSGYTSVGGDIKDVVNCISDTTVTAPVCTFYDETYSVTYDCNGGTGSATGYATYNSVFTPRTDVCARDGYSFNGYTINGNTVPESFTWTYPGPRTLVAQWAQKAVITFDINIAPEQEQWLVVDNYTESVTVLDGELSAQIITPQMENGYKFGGYWTEPDGGDMHYDIDGNHLVNNITEDITLYAHWVPHSGNLAFDANGGTGTAPQSPDVCNYDSCIVPENTFTAPENYEFAGWTYQDDGMGETFVDSGENIGRAFVSSFMNGRTLTLYPVWEKIVCADGLMLVNGTCVVPEFTITTTEMSAGATFSFQMSASGVFYVDFDDGRGVQKIDRTNKTSNTTYTSAAYSTAGTHIIKMYGDATGYTTSSYVAAIGFHYNKNIKTVDGSLGAIFGGNTPYMFNYTFNGCTSLQSIPADLFSGVTGSSEYMFNLTFANCTSLESIPADLFSGVTGSSEYMFNHTFINCTSLQSIPAGLFSGVTGSSDWLFNYTFGGCTSLESIPADLFSGVTGSGEFMFSSTFYDCTSLQSIPADLFSGVTGSAYSMFSNTFRGCTSLQSIPADLFSGVTGSSESMFSNTFSGCTSLESIPAGLFSGVTGSSEYMFASTFSYCTSLESIPAGLFSGVTGSSDWLFASTFYDCTSLESIPAGLFSGVTGSSKSMFSSTFGGCTSLESIPADLFSGVTGSSDWLFSSTFWGCTSLESIPADLFSGVTGSSESMFSYTFKNCTSLASLPDGLFKNIEGKPATNMFYETFRNCTNLSGYIPADTFAKMDSTDFNSATMGSIFASTALDTSCPAGTYQYITGFESAWNNKVACTPCPGGLTSAIGATSIDECGAVRTLHIGDNDTMQLFSIRPSSSPVMVFEIDGQYKYFGQMSDIPKTISSDSDKHFIIKYNDTEYYLHDYTVE